MFQSNKCTTAEEEDVLGINLQANLKVSSGYTIQTQAPNAIAHIIWPQPQEGRREAEANVEIHLSASWHTTRLVPRYQPLKSNLAISRAWRHLVAAFESVDMTNAHLRCSKVNIVTYGLYLYEVSFGIFSSALFRDIDNSAFNEFEEGLLDPFPTDIPCDADALTFLGHLVNLKRRILDLRPPCVPFIKKGPLQLS